MTAGRMIYHIHYRASLPGLISAWTATEWQSAEVAEVAHFRPESSSHRPKTLVRLLASAVGLHGIFHVQDRYVRCLRQNYFDDVWKDSCVEFFVQPKAEAGYFNFEFNCGGAFLCNYILDPTRTPRGFARAEKMPPESAAQVKVQSSLPRMVEPEVSSPINWTLAFFVPFGVFEQFVGPVGHVQGQTWRGNFFKCAEEVSHPHWASWSPVDEFNFHLPRCFGELRFVA
jgi:hypothetical protein